MAFFLRSASLQVGTSRYSMDDGFYFDFEVPFYDSDQLSTAGMTIYNMSPASRAAIQKNQVVIINAGYQDDVGVLFVGQVATYSHKQNNTDWQTKITATAALDQWLGTQVNKTYAEMSKAEDIVRDLLNIFGLEVGIFELVENPTYPRGKVCAGKLRDVLTDIVINECKSRFLIRMNQIIINNPAVGVQTGYLLTPESGLLMYSEDSDTKQTTADDSKTSDQKQAEEKTWTRKCLLNYRMGPGDLLQIQSKDLEGKFQIISGKHKGNPTGAWTTEIEVRMVG